MIVDCPSSIFEERYRNASRSIGQLGVFPCFEIGNKALVDGLDGSVRVDYQKAYGSQDRTKRFYNIQVQTNDTLFKGLKYPQNATKKGTSLFEVDVE